MSVRSLAPIEHSEPFINGIIERRAEAGWEGLNAADIIGELALYRQIADSRGLATNLLVIAGGAASGKSTLAASMSAELAARGTSSAIISSDDFVRWDRAKRHRLERIGLLPPDAKYDFFSLRQAIGAVCANQHPSLLVGLPQYDSHTGLAASGSKRQFIPAVNTLIVEGDMLGEQGKTPQDLYASSAYRPRTVYIHVPDEERLKRRVARDITERNAQGAVRQDIVDSFEHRQKSQHIPYTLTYAETADAIVRPMPDNPGLYEMYTMASAS